ncbi:MAG TPA: archease [Caulobacteraceae bacterium]|nr:archease [Caulobacteraceae bacterium]
MRSTSSPEAGAPAPVWETFAHGSDVGVRGRGATAAEAFANAALAMTAVIADPASVRPTRPVHVRCAGTDLDILLLDWLNALVTRMAIEGMLFRRFDVELKPGRLEATAWGEAVDRARHAPAVEVKGATLTELKVTREDGAWLAQCVVDV